MSELYTAVVNLEISEISFCGNLHTAVFYWNIYILFIYFEFRSRRKFSLINKDNRKCNFIYKKTNGQLRNYNIIFDVCL